MARYEIYVQGKLQSLSVQAGGGREEPDSGRPEAGRAEDRGKKGDGPGEPGRARAGPRRRTKSAKAVAESIVSDIQDSVMMVHAQNERLGPLFHDTRETTMQMVAPGSTSRSCWSPTRS